MQQGDIVIHKEFGRGKIEAVLTDSQVVVRFDSDRQNGKFISISELAPVASFSDQLSASVDNEIEKKALVHIQGEVVKFINNSWGLFSSSSIELLPHQLWVCKQVLSRWPIGYVIADDVGLGKTIEAGLIMTSLFSTGKVRRILILAPAKLVGQWQERMKSMFNLGFFAYSTEVEKTNPDFWTSATFVVASASTMQADSHGRFDHLCDAPAWDLVVVDEAHHMNAEEQGNKTLQFKLFEMLQENGKIVSSLLFTGTPHRGKNYGFWSLMSLVAPGVFGPGKDEASQYSHLKDYFIRNNKKNVVDMKGKILFTKMTQHPYTFTYSPEEKEFYDAMTAFISAGYMYAKTLGNAGSAVGLLLSCLQKIASSSIAAISSALKNRKEALEWKATAYKNFLSNYGEDEREGFDDEATISVQTLAEPLKLMENEIDHINLLLEKATKVTSETRINRIVEIIKEKYPNDQVLLFTEYKRTQSLMMTELMKVWGDNSVTIINGDESLKDVVYPDGCSRDISISRNDACEKFNNGEVRFLISTEAAGEGIDLQKNCHVLIHIDLPWNPMRLHQRVGRVHRLGQTHDVEVVSVRNPDNIESKIWGYLEEKIDQIQKMLSESMDDPDDMMQIVLGMQSSQFFTDVMEKTDFAEAKQSVDKWFDKTTGKFGGESAVDTATKLGLNASKFNLSGLDDIPKLDLPNLVSFMKRALEVRGKRLMYEEADDTYRFNIPNEWRTFGVRAVVNKAVFRRQLNDGEKQSDIIGVGSKVVNNALEDASRFENSVVHISGTNSYFVYSVMESSSRGNESGNPQLFVVNYDANSQAVKEMSIDGFYQFLENVKSSQDTNAGYLKNVPEIVQELAEQKKVSLNMTSPNMRLEGILCGASCA